MSRSQRSIASESDRVAVPRTVPRCSWRPANLSHWAEPSSMSREFVTSRQKSTTPWGPRPVATSSAKTGSSACRDRTAAR